ncbi:MAG: ABC transporter ATP-binding protein [Chitinispirillia bacterium]|nr:ABC transporter ATP-binding protein [Chitinispirillia bacterium]MCL2241390.1 ABC transporter ATP-binding protein [Chitinispirillia bacterium]
MTCEIQNIAKAYPSPSGQEPLVILDDISLSLNKGESAAIVGPSGSGKTTLLHIAAGLEAPDAGRVLIDGNDISGLNENELAFTRNRKIGVVFQRHGLLPQCTLLENVLIPTLPYQNRRERDLLRQRAMNMLDRLGLSKRLGHFPSQLSGGECQRAALARALINCPSLLCADEPTGSLDNESAIEMGRLLREVNKEEQTALILVTHSEKLAAEMDRILELRNGKLNAGK